MLARRGTDSTLPTVPLPQLNRQTLGGSNPGHRIMNLFTFKGRASRREFFLHTASGMAFGFCVGLVLYYILINKWLPFLTVSGALYFFEATLLFAFADDICVTVRRFHDMDRPGTHWLGLLIPVVNLGILAVLYFKPGSNGPNRYDPGAQPETPPTTAEATKYTCGNCGADIQWGASQCQNCGESLEY